MPLSPTNINSTVNDYRTTKFGLEYCGLDQIIIQKAFTSDYSKRIYLGQTLPVLAYTLNRTSDHASWFYISNTIGNFDKGIYTSAVNAYQNYDAGLPLYPDSFSLANSKAVESFFENGRNGKSSIGVSIAELPKTVALIGNTAKRLAGAFRALKRFNIPEAFRELGLTSKVEMRRFTKMGRAYKRSKGGRLDFASKSWLELQYGWKPLLSEIDNAAQDLAARFALNDNDIIIRGTGNCKVNPTSTPGVAFAFNGLVKSTSYAERESRVGYVCLARVLDANKRTYAGMGLSNPLAIAWELVPFSFVVDWFAPIGSWLGSLDALSGLSFRSGSRSHLMKTKSLHSFKGQKLSGNCFRVRGIIRGHENVQFTRIVLAGFPSGFNILRVRGISDALGTTRSLSSLALLKQVFK